MHTWGLCPSETNPALERPFDWRLFKRWIQQLRLPCLRIVLAPTDYRVEHVFLIQSHSGLVLDYAGEGAGSGLDCDAVGGMFTAINQYLRDSVGLGGSVGDGFVIATMGAHSLIARHGVYATLMVVVRDCAAEHFGHRLKGQLDRLERQMGTMGPPNCGGRQLAC